LRRALGKGFTDDRIIDLAVKAMELGFTHLKLYFMVGLPGETIDDTKSIINLLLRLRNAGVKFSLSVNPWIPKPHTPLQWLPMATEEIIKQRTKMLRDVQAYIEFSAYDALDAKVQALLSLGDRDVANVIFEAYLVYKGYVTAYRLMRDKYVAGGESLYTWLRMYRKIMG